MKNDILKARIGFGTYKILDQDEMNGAIEHAILAGYDFIDTAKLYKTEVLIANALDVFRKKHPAVEIPVIQSKIWPSDFKNGVEAEIKLAMERLRVDHIHSFVLHRPHVDNTMNVQAWKELVECKKKGLVTYIGVSNFEPDMIRILINETKVKPDFVHNEASVTYIRKDRIRHANDEKMAMQGWRPYGNAVKNFKCEILAEMAKKYNCSPAQIMIAYSRAFGFCPVPRSSIKEEIYDSIKGLDVKLSDADVAFLETKLNEHKSTTGYSTDSYANLALDDDWYKTV